MSASATNVKIAAAWDLTPGDLSDAGIVGIVRANERGNHRLAVAIHLALSGTDRKGSDLATAIGMDKGQVSYLARAGALIVACGPVQGPKIARDAVYVASKINAKIATERGYGTTVTGGALVAALKAERPVIAENLKAGRKADGSPRESVVAPASETTASNGTTVPTVETTGSASTNGARFASVESMLSALAAAEYSPDSDSIVTVLALAADLARTAGLKPAAIAAAVRPSSSIVVAV